MILRIYPHLHITFKAKAGIFQCTVWFTFSQAVLSMSSRCQAEKEGDAVASSTDDTTTGKQSAQMTTQAVQFG